MRGRCSGGLEVLVSQPRAVLWWGQQVQGVALRTWCGHQGRGGVLVVTGLVWQAEYAHGGPPAMVH